VCDSINKNRFVTIFTVKSFYPIKAGVIEIFRYDKKSLDGKCRREDPYKE